MGRLLTFTYTGLWNSDVLMRIESEQVLRNVCMASVLEPIPEKVGCTTRKIDLKPTTRLEHFIIAGINIGWDFYKLAERIKNNEYEQPKIIFDISYEAQSNSFNNRTGKKINFGIIELFVPIITSQLVYDCNGEETIDKAIDVMKNTTKIDVKWHYFFRRLAKSKSSSKDPVLFLDVDNVYEYFLKAPKNRDNDIIFHDQMINGLPILKKAYKIMSTVAPANNLLDASVDAYDTILKECRNIPGVAADYICIAMYLTICDNPDLTII